MVLKLVIYLAKLLYHYNGNCQGVGYIRQWMNIQFLKLKDLSDFDKGQIVMARWLGQSIPKKPRLVGNMGTQDSLKHVGVNLSGPVSQKSYFSSNEWKT